jgi:hypothetical protein
MKETGFAARLFGAERVILVRFPLCKNARDFAASVDPAGVAPSDSAEPPHRRRTKKPPLGAVIQRRLYSVRVTPFRRSV